MDSFVYNGNPGRVIFGRGTISRLGEEADRLGVQRILVLSTPGQANQAAGIARNLGNRYIGLYAKARMHTPTDTTAEAMELIQSLRADAVLAIGGGSTIGLGKAIAFRTDIPQVVVPTTYAGSEATPILGETENGRKVTKSSAKILPEVIVYDVDLTLTLPLAMSVTSGMNAIAHAVEALYAREANPVISLMATEGIGAIVGALPLLKDDPHNIMGRRDALYGAWLCGICLGSVGMALHHKICHTLGGMFDLPHAQLHTAVLPHAVAYNQNSALEAMARIKASLGWTDPAAALYKLALELGAKMSLRELGMKADGIEPALAQMLSNPYWNPRKLEEGPLRKLLIQAFEGTEPDTRVMQLP
ncbi:maleylacetate reductase [Mesorhizobium erdmanii]|uniref:maleylacetate reductase n=1 Tax=Mesorhizobium erdmanii TaxID=1777866 RepID=UPI000429E5AE|nr:maleylacetate reductase [Mesorhizobium erdmanii]